MANITQQIEKAEKVARNALERIEKLKAEAAKPPKPKRGAVKSLTIQLDVDRLAKFRKRCDLLDTPLWRGMEEAIDDWDKKKTAQS